MRKKIIIVFVLIFLSIALAYKAHSFYTKDTQQELEGRQLENKKEWTKIFKDMPVEQIKELLGKPERTMEGATTIWFYQKGGNVEFYNGKVIKWTKPYTWDY